MGKLIFEKVAIFRKKSCHFVKFVIVHKNYYMTRIYNKRHTSNYIIARKW